jgi:hypothetical protein
MTYPIRAAVIVPKDYAPLPASTTEIRIRCQSWLNRMQTYVKQEAGVTFDYSLRMLRSKYTHLELATEHNGTVRIDECGQGIDEGQIWWKCCREELAWPTNEPYRWTAFVFGAGGWAGGRNNFPGEDVGTCLIGDWNLKANVGAKRCDPCCAKWHGMNSQVCMSNGSGWSHEMLHLFGVQCHDPSTYPFDGQGLNIEQKIELLTKNKPFLRDA